MNRLSDVGLPLLEKSTLQSFSSHVARHLPNQLYHKHDVGHRLLLLTSGIPGVAPPTDLPPLARTTGPWLPRDSAPLAKDVADFLSSKPYVFVSLGTNARWHCGEAQAFYSALQKLQYNVLWSIPEAQARECKIPLSPATGSLKTVPFVDQVSVLKHLNIRAFVSHCGYASLTEAIFYGVPTECCLSGHARQRPANQRAARRVAPRGEAHLVSAPLAANHG